MGISGRNTSAPVSPLPTLLYCAATLVFLDGGPRYSCLRALRAERKERVRPKRSLSATIGRQVSFGKPIAALILVGDENRSGEGVLPGAPPTIATEEMVNYPPPSIPAEQFCGQER
mmetsp:Transcript_8100/g.16791  ORF Transcript_8100/g.16791 Transcript_8100/m.16791 type:complete len:116 (+) Transcript_8100:466-813(+)